MPAHKVTVDGRPCEVLEDLGFNHSAGYHAKIILLDGEEKVAVKDGGHWRLWAPQDRMRPGGRATGQRLRGTEAYNEADQSRRQSPTAE